MEYIAAHTSQMLLNLQMIVDPMDENLWEYTAFNPGHAPLFRSCMVYYGQTGLSEDVLYLIPEGYVRQFPVDNYSYITTEDVRGAAPHIRAVKRPFEEVLNLVMGTFQRYREFEFSLNQVISNGGDLTRMCQICSDFFRNPVYIHDDLFSVIASSARVQGMLELEHNRESNNAHIPLWLINEFKFDKSYSETLELRKAGIWGNDQFPFNMRSLFVNLWDGNRYRGRVLINEIGSSLQPGQFCAAEYMAEYITVLMRHLDQQRDRDYRSFQETLLCLIDAEPVNERDLRTMLEILDWSEEDTYLCLKLQPQEPGMSIRSDSALYSEISSQLRASVSFYHQKRLCILVDLSKTELDEKSIRQIFAPLVRDSYMYGGISNPVEGIRQIRSGFQQTDIALRSILKESSVWLVPFSSCALSYIQECACSQFPAELVVHPVLRKLQQIDRETGTEYYKTLRTFLCSERNIPLASKKLIIHRTTLSYRLEKLKELTNLNLEDENLRLYLLMSFHLLEKRI